MSPISKRIQNTAALTWTIAAGIIIGRESVMAEPEWIAMIISEVAAVLGCVVILANTRRD